MAIGAFVLLVVLVSQAAFNLKFISPNSNRQLLFFAALTILIFLLFVALTFVLARNLLKLLVERRLGVIGSKFRTRMVVGALLLYGLGILTKESAGSRVLLKRFAKTLPPWHRCCRPTLLKMRRRKRKPSRKRPNRSVHSTL